MATVISLWLALYSLCFNLIANRLSAQSNDDSRRGNNQCIQCMFFITVPVWSASVIQNDHLAE